MSKSSRAHLVARIALCAFGIALWLSASHAQSSDMELAPERDRLLTTYSVFTDYGAPPAVVYQRLESDRKAVFDASIRAIFQAIEDRPGHSGGKREIDYLEEVRGIWGVRRNDTHGERMFRLSVLWRPGITKALRDSDNIEKGSFAHVLLPEPTGGDDNPAFTNFRMLERGLETFLYTHSPNKLRTRSSL